MIGLQIDKKKCPPVKKMRPCIDLLINDLYQPDCAYAEDMVLGFCYVNTLRLKIILCSGTIGTELSSSNLGMFMTSDAGNSWRQVKAILC